MKNETPENATALNDQNESSEKSSIENKGMNRRKFVEMAAASAIGFTIIPRHVLGGKGYIAPSDKITLAYIGTGTEGIREMLPMLQVPEIQIVAVCDPQKEARGYRDWGTTYLRDAIRKTLNDSNWQPGGDGIIPGGRDCGQNIVNQYYSNQKNTDYKGCDAYEDVRELLNKGKDIDAVKIMTPDHLHGVLSIAAMKRGKHVMMHKPLSNRLLEGKKVIETARNSKVITHFLPWDSNGSMDQVMQWINSGTIGNLLEVHNWTNRPVWPQYAKLPTDKPSLPQGFNWDLWLGPEAMRDYSPDYTNMVFRGWYDFGGGAMADMGHYSLWTVFIALKLTSPTIVQPYRSHVVDFNGSVPFRINNDFAFPYAGVVRFKYPANDNRGPVDLCWYDGGMRPPTPIELANAGKDLEQEGMMFVGDKGKILAGFNVQNPVILSGTLTNDKAGKSTGSTSGGNDELQPLKDFAAACKTGKQNPGSFAEAEYLTEAVNLYAVALRANKLLKYDAANLKITNVADANKYLSRNYRSGWDLENI
jgi:hypothetical protein